MYARNNASPRPILIGTIAQISDGAVQTTGVSVKVSKDGGAYAAGAGTTAVEEGEWSYTPSQGETDCETLRVILYKTACYSRSQQVVFSASASFGYTGTDQSKIANPTSTVNLSNTTIKTATDVETNTQDIQNRLPAALDNGRLVVTIGAYQTGNAPLQPTVAGRTLDVTANGNAGIDWGNVENQGATVDLAGTTVDVANNVNAANLADPIGQIWEVAISSLTANGTIGKLLTDNINATISSRLAAASYTAPLNATGTADAVWNALIASYTVSGSFGSRVLRTDNSSAGHEAKVTGAGHVAADIHELQPAVIASTHFAPGAIDDNALASSAVTEIGVGVWVSAGYAAAIRAAVGLAAADLDTQLDAIAAAVNPGAVWTDPAAATTIRAAMGLATANLDAQLAAALVLQKLAASGATGSVQVTDNGNGTATLVFKDTNGTTTLATVTYNYTSGARTRVS